MAIEIPPLVTDRLPRPDWSVSGVPVREELTASRLLATLEGLELPAGLLEGLRALAAAGRNVPIFVAADHGLVQVQIEGRRLPLAGAARDAVLVALGSSGQTDTGRSAIASGPGLFRDLATAARIAGIDAQVKEGRAGIPLDAGALADVAEAEHSLPPVPQRALTLLALPILQSGGSADPARDLADAVGASGLFLESHLAQWVRGERSLPQIEEEARRLPLLVRAGQEEAMDQRGSQQLHALQHQAFVLGAQAWPGQSVQIAIERDREHHPEAANTGDPTGVFQAVLTLQLPHLGTLHARVRVMENTVGVQLESTQPDALETQLPVLAAALLARGLSLAQLSTAAPRPAAVSA